MSDPAADFMSITGCTNAATATFYIDSANGDLNQAVETYLEEGNLEGSTEPEADPPLPADEPPQAAYTAPQPYSAQSGRSRVRGLGDMGGDDDTDEDEHQDYYAGGQKSGQMVRAPKKDTNEQVGGLFEAARRTSDARDGTAADLEEADPNAFHAFSGSANTLTAGSVARPAAGSTPAEAAAGRPRHTITFYSGGVFTVNDGPARHYQDPANGAFISAIGAGMVPKELESDGQAVEVNLVRKDEEYVEPPYRAFSGAGQRLASDSVGPSAAPQPAVTGEWGGVDEALPTTSLQLRLLDGSRLVGRFNLHHTGADVRRFVAASRPDAPREYRLMGGFPSKPLDNDKTIEEAGLQNAALVLRA